MSLVAPVVFGLLLCLATVAGVVAGDGSIGLALAAPLLFAALYAVWKLPLRWPMLVLTFLALTLENPADVPAQGMWKSPLYTAGALFLTHLNVTIKNKALLFSGLDLVLVYLGVVVAGRAIVAPRRDKSASPLASPLQPFLLAALVGAAWMWIYGVVVGGADVASSLWQVQRVVYLPTLTLLYTAAIKGPRDYVAFGKVLIAAACIKACLAIYIDATVPPPPGLKELQYATTHTDSMLFANASCVILVVLMHGADLRRGLLTASVLPLLIAGMVANHRRLAWVEIAAGLFVVLALARRSRVKLALLRGAVVTSPGLIAYGAVGWGSTASVFKPVRTIRSVVDSNADMSTTWRDWENYDLAQTLRLHPIFGTGYGHPYVELAKLPDVSYAYALERFVPHNSVLGLWAYGGLVGFSALWTMFAVGIFLASRAYRYATTAPDRVAALGSVIAIVIYFAHCYGDLGLGTWTGVFTTAPALAIGSRVALSTGAWGNARRARPAIPVDVTAKEVVV